MSINQGQVTSTVTQQYLVTPVQPGTYIIPSLQVTLGSQTLTSQPLKLVAVKATESAAGTNQPLALLRIFLPRREVYVGEAIRVEIQVLIRDGVLNAEEILRAFDSYTGTLISAEGCRVLRTAHAQRRRAQWNGVSYTLSTLVTALSPARTGTVTIKSTEVPLTLQLPLPGQRRRDYFDPFGMFQQAQEQRVVLNAEPQELQVLPVPTAGRPADFNGAVGNFTLRMEAGPTNVNAGDPITVRVRIEGTGDLESLSLPEQSAWQAFRAYPPSAAIESQDPLRLEGAKIFEQVLVPQTADISSLPGVTFTYFDSSQRDFRTLNHPDLPLAVQSVGATPAPAIAAPRMESEQENPSAQDIVPIKRRLGRNRPNVPLILRPFFIAVNLVPVIAFGVAVLWRKRAEADRLNPRRRRAREVDLAVRDGIRRLHQFANEKDSDQFFATMFRLLQERISERLDVPSSSITEAVIEERLRPGGANEDLLRRLESLFHSCNLARYAPVQSSQTLQALIPDTERVLTELREVQL